jgi:hypothetical protein
MIDKFEVSKNGGDSVLKNLEINSYIYDKNRINNCK